MPGGWQTFSVKEQTVKIFGFTGHTVSVATKLCHCTMKAAIDNV